MKKAFTLVELLIVIALIAILSVAVLATINPIEQSNKARDASVKNDAAEVLNAYERFYASQNAYPWNIIGASFPDTWVGVLGSTDPAFGVTDVGSTDGALIVTSELKSAFASKKPFISDSPAEDRLFAVHTASDNYVCYFPKANVSRTGTTGEGLKCLSGVGEDANLTDLSDSCTVPSPWVYGIGDSNANLLCVPEGDVN